MTEQNIRDAFEVFAKNKMASKDLERRGDGYLSPFVDAMWIAFKAGRTLAFNVILESEND
jgi:hypothetical protein